MTRLESSTKAKNSTNLNTASVRCTSEVRVVSGRSYKFASNQHTKKPKIQLAVSDKKGVMMSSQSQI